MEKLLETAIEILTPVLIALLGLATSYFIAFINKAKTRVLLESEKIENEKQKQLVNGAIEQLHTIATGTIIQAENTLVKEIKQATEDNKLTVEEGKEVANAVVNSIMNQLTNDSKELLETQSQSLENYIRGEVEVILQKIKNKTF